MSRPTAQDGQIRAASRHLLAHEHGVPAIQHELGQIVEDRDAIRIDGAVVDLARVIDNVEQLTGLAIVVVEFPVTASHHALHDAVLRSGAAGASAVQAEL